MSEINVKGLADLQKLLDQLPVKIERNVLSGALRAGANVIKDEAKQRCPVGPPSSTGKKRYNLYAGALRDSIRVRTRTIKGVVTATIKAGGKSKNGADVWYAHIIEYAGAKSHYIGAVYAKSLGLVASKISSTGYVRRLMISGIVLSGVKHPGMQKKPFMRPALDGKAGAAVQAAGEYIKKRLQTKEGIDTSGITIEVQE